MEPEGTPTRWVVGCDGSDSAVAALRWAAARAQERKERLVPVAAYVVPRPISATVAGPELTAERHRLAADARSAVVSGFVAAGLGAEPPTESMVLVEGQPPIALLDQSGPGTVVVVGRRGVGALRRRLLGSVSQYVVTHARGPVVVVPEGAERSACRRIVVGFDGSDHSVHALEWALSIAPADAEIEVLMAIEVSPWLNEDLVLARFPDEVRSESSRLDNAADQADPGRRATRHVVLHSARRALGEASGSVDLIVVGARGRGAVGSALLGSVTTWLLHAVSCPVAVIP